MRALIDDMLEGIVVDLFVGGRASIGVERALGRPVTVAVNHSPQAIAMHETNHPLARQFYDSVWQVDPLTATRGQPVALLWASPDCKHFSKAKGGAPNRSTEIRALAWLVPRWAAVVRPRVVMLENLEEFSGRWPLRLSKALQKQWYWSGLENQQKTANFCCPQTPSRTFGILEGFWYTGDMILGYARVSTHEQNLDAQIDALTGAGAKRIFEEKATGRDVRRPELQRLLEQLRDGDVVVVTKYDHLACSFKDLIDIVDAIRHLGAGFRSRGEDIDTRIPTRRLISHVFGSIAEFERERIVERTGEGLAAARRRGRRGRRPPALSSTQKIKVRRMRNVDQQSVSQITNLFKISQ